MRDAQREAETEAKREAGPCWEPDMGLNPRTPGSPPEPKADAQPQSHPGIPIMELFGPHFPYNRTARLTGG